MEQITLQDQLSAENLYTNQPGVRIDRLMTLATLLEDVAADEEVRAHFNLQQWMGLPAAWGFSGVDGYEFAASAGIISEVHEAKEVGVCVEPEPILECGFAACAIGWAGTHPVFREQGFCLTAFEHGSVAPALREAGMRGWQAVYRFFGITESQGYRLFDSEAYSREQASDPLAVVRRIHALVEELVA